MGCSAGLVKIVCDFWSELRMNATARKLMRFEQALRVTARMFTKYAGYLVRFGE